MKSTVPGCERMKKDFAMKKETESLFRVEEHDSRSAAAETAATTLLLLATSTKLCGILHFASASTSRYSMVSVNHSDHQSRTRRVVMSESISHDMVISLARRLKSLRTFLEAAREVILWGSLLPQQLRRQCFKVRLICEVQFFFFF